jgi:hypothetical protein
VLVFAALPAGHVTCNWTVRLGPRINPSVSEYTRRAYISPPPPAALAKYTVRTATGSVSPDVSVT